MSQTQCPYCAASDGRCVVPGGGRFLTECRSCGRVTEERVSEVEELFIERAHDAPLCIVTPDFSENESYKAPPIEDDPFESIGFITAFSTWSLEKSPLFTATCTGYSGHLAELERILSESLCSGGGTMPTSLAGASMSLIDTLRAYFQIVEVSSILGLERESCDHAIQLFRECISTTYVRNRNTVEALATAALVQAIREGQEPRTLQEISAAANIPQKEIGRHMKLLSDSLKLSQPINSNSISVHMPRFCNLLQLSKSTQDLATHIGEVVINKSFCTRRNPISISAAAIYLSCQLEDKRKTQTEICKATGLTEVTLRKVYKELLENLDDLLPSDYTPAVPLEKAFPVTAVALGRVHVARAAGGGALTDTPLPSTHYSTAMSNNGAGVAGDSSSMVGGSASGASPPAQPNLVRVPVSGTGLERGAAAVATYICPTASADAGPAIPLFSLPHGAVGGSPVGIEATDKVRLDGSQEIDRDPSEQEREKERERDRMDADYAQKNVGMLPATSVSGFRPSFFPIPVDPRLFQEINPVMWPLQLYGGPPIRPAEDGLASARGAERTSREDGAGIATLANSKPGPPPQQQYVSFLPGMPESLNPSLQVKMLPLMQGRPLDVAERQGVFERERDSEEGITGIECGENGSHASPVPTANSAATLQNFAAAAAAAAAASGRQGTPMFPGFPPGLWPFVGPGGSGPYGVFPPQLVQPQSGGLPQGLRQCGNNHSIVSEKSLEGLPQGLLASAGAEALARMTGPGVTSQAGGLGGQANHLIPWPGAPFHPLFLPSPMNVSPGPPGGISNGISSIDVSSGMQNDVSDGGGRTDVGGAGGGVDGSTRAGAGGGGLDLTQQPAPDHFPMLSIGVNSGQHVAAGHLPIVTPQHSDNVEVPPTSAPLANQVSFERQTPHE